jgi:cob(I)alamin adenosyltransferase
MIVLETIHGTGRGKTTNAIGRIFSAFMKKKKIFVIQFLKSGKECGECSFFNAFAETKWFSIGEKGVFYDFKKENKELKLFIKRELTKIIETLRPESTDILLLDELGIALFYNLIDWEMIVPIFEYVKEKVIITGRKVPIWLLEKSVKSLEIREIKHPYKTGIKARRGIDF